MNPAELSLDQYDVEYDTDEVSITSTVEEEEGDNFFEAENILSECPDDETGKRYLIKWTGYPIHECTWEPPENIANTNLLHVWTNRRIDMGPQKFDEMVAQNHDKFDEAVEKAEAAKARRHDKRVKKRRKLRRKQVKTIIVSSDSDSDNENDSIVRNRNVPKKQVPIQSGRWEQSDSDSDVPLTSMSKRKQANATTSNPASRETSANIPSLFVSEKIASKPRRALPIQQSSTEESSDDGSVPSRDSLGEKNRKPSLSKPSDKVKTLTGSTKTSSTADKIASQSSKPSSALSDKEVIGRNPTVQSIANKSAPKKSATHVQAKSAVPVPVRRTSTSSTPSTASTTISPSTNRALRTGTTSSVKSSAPIRIVNQPKIAERERKQGNGLYKKLRFRETAAKRGRREGTPDASALDFVNGVPRGLPPQKTAEEQSYYNPYSRRESGLRGPVKEDEQITTSPHSMSKLEPYEAGKLPYSCFEWRNGSCNYSAQDCRWLHRSKDAYGNDLPISSFDGTVPPKFQTPPQTCFFWLRGDKGCTNTAEQCPYLHENKGLLGSVHGTGPQTIDPAETPHNINTRPDNGMPQSINSTESFQNLLPKKDLTCWYWLRHPQGCNKPANICMFQHENTGILAGRSIKEQYETIDPNEQPKSQASKLQAGVGAQKTCFFWNEGHCKNLEENCPYIHQYTGQIAQPPQFWKPPPGWTHKFRGLDEVMPLVAPNVPIEPDGVDEPMPDAIQETSKPAPVPGSSVDVETKIASACKLDFDDMFTYNNSDTADARLDRRAFLIFHPEDHAKELELLTRWLLLHSVEVFNFWCVGSWEAFQKETSGGKTGVIIAHPQFELWAEIPRFDEILRKKLRFWSIGNQEAYEYDPDISKVPPVFRYDRIEIFPHGGIIYITDDVFDKKPKLALKIIELFFAKIEKCRQVAGPEDPFKRVNDGCLIWRLAVRPDFMQALYDKVTEEHQYAPQGSPEQTARIKLYELLDSTQYIEQDSLPPDAPTYPDDYYPIMSERGSVMENFYYDQYGPSDQRKLHPFATTKMVQYYGGMLIDKRQYYRQYFVVHTDPHSVSAQDWRKRIGVLDDVLSPEVFADYLAKEGRGNRFEFYEWAFPPKEAVSLAA